MGLALLAAIWPLLGPAVRWSTGGSAIYRQERAGRGDSVFMMLKLRTMPPGSEPHGPAMATREDNRATPLGQWLRRTHLDELPQAWNVVRGEMSIIGPRPERPDFTATLSRTVPGYSRRLRVRPGVTGWAQVRQGHAATTAEHAEKARLDAEYLDHRTLARDLQILARTIGEVACGAVRTRSRHVVKTTCAT